MVQVENLESWGQYGSSESGTSRLGTSMVSPLLRGEGWSCRFLGLCQVSKRFWGVLPRPRCRANDGRTHDNTLSGGNCCSVFGLHHMHMSIQNLALH